MGVKPKIANAARKTFFEKFAKLLILHLKVKNTGNKNRSLNILFLFRGLKSFHLKNSVQIVFKSSKFAKINKKFCGRYLRFQGGPAHV